MVVFLLCCYDFLICDVDTFADTMIYFQYFTALLSFTRMLNKTHKGTAQSRAWDQTQTNRLSRSTTKQVCEGMKEVNFVKAQRNKVAVGIERAFLYWAHDMTAQSGGVTVNSETDDWPVKHMAGFTLGRPELQLARTKASFLLKSLTSINQSYDSSFSRWHVCQLNAQKTLSLSLLWHLCPFY